MACHVRWRSRPAGHSHGFQGCPKMHLLRNASCLPCCVTRSCLAHACGACVSLVHTSVRPCTKQNCLTLPSLLLLCSCSCSYCSCRCSPPLSCRETDTGAAQTSSINNSPAPSPRVPHRPARPCTFPPSTLRRDTCVHRNGRSNYPSDPGVLGLGSLASDASRSATWRPRNGCQARWSWPAASAVKGKKGQLD